MLPPGNLEELPTSECDGQWGCGSNSVQAVGTVWYRPQQATPTKGHNNVALTTLQTQSSTGSDRLMGPTPYPCPQALDALVLCVTGSLPWGMGPGACSAPELGPTGLGGALWCPGGPCPLESGGPSHSAACQVFTDCPSRDA